ncbi:hypothetical protein GCK32_004317 [Trichostrongylus colubriformis]|uniref:Uncharacterized protein n=1 Tax=Trichostrongylus colubriformis TaxID=6319 RepID=A0AAN8IIJ6_TRICO
MSCESTQSSSEGPIEDLLDLDIKSAEALMTNIHDCSTKKRLSRKQRQKRAAEPSDNTHNTEPPKKIAALTNAPKMTLRPLLISHDDKGVMSNKDIRDIFYAVMDGITDIKKKQDRLEDRLRILDTRTAVFEAWLKRFEAEMKERRSAQMVSSCPLVPPSRFCEVCYIAGHQAAQCRSRVKMDAEHVEKLYATKGICKKCNGVSMDDNLQVYVNCRYMQVYVGICKIVWN